MQAPGMRSPLVRVAFVAAALLFGCESRNPTPEKSAPAAQKPAARAPLVDLTAATSLEAVRTAFNAHKGEARFLTLRSPT